MKCNEIKKLLNPYIDNELSEEDTNRVKMHLQECIDCAEETAELDKVRQMVYELPKLKAPMELVENVRQGIVDIKQPKVSVFWRYSWVIGSFASAAAVFLLVYIAVINPYQYRNYPVGESVSNEQKRPEGLLRESEILTRQTAPMLHQEGESAKDEPIKLSDSSAAILSQNMRITTDDIDETKDKIYEAANITKDGFVRWAPKSHTDSLGEGSSDKKNKGSDVIEYKPAESATESQRESLRKEKSQRSTVSGFTPQPSSKIAKQSPQQYVVKFTIPLSKRDAFIQDIKNNISGRMILSKMRVASKGTLMISKALAEKITERDKELSELADNEFNGKKDNQRRGGVLSKSDAAKMSQGESSVAKLEDKENAIQPSAQPQKPASTPPEADPRLTVVGQVPMAQGSSKKVASEKTGGMASSPAEPLSPSAPSHSKEFAKNDVKDKSLDAGEALNKANEIPKEDKRESDKLQNDINEIMVEFTIIIEEKIK
ncbi:MAG: zf-HC2 domain-containing protein [Planctomycetota bacterium]